MKVRVVSDELIRVVVESDSINLLKRLTGYYF